MQLMDTFRRSTRLGVLSLALSVGTMAHAEVVDESPSAFEMIADAAVARPLYFALSQVGAFLYGITLPLTLLGDNADQAAETLVVTPLQAAFLRCLGCGDVESAVYNLEEGEGKLIRHFLKLSGNVTFYGTGGQDVNTFGGGLHLGTNFDLSNRTTFDVMLGARYLGEAKFDDKAGQKAGYGGAFNDTVMSYEIVSRFGKEVIGDISLLGSLGLNYWTAERERAGATGITSGVGFFWGLGAAVPIGDDLRFDIGYNRYLLRNTTKIDYKATLNTVDIGLTIKF